MRLENNYTEILTALINKQNSEGLTALHYASFRGNIKIINILIQNGADISLVGIKGSSVMHLAAKGNQPSSLVLFKEKYKQSINILDNAEDTPLHVAAENGCDLALTFLLSWNANPNCQNKVGYTPLHLAVINGRVKAIKKLMQKGADPSLKDYKQNKSCVQYATETLKDLNGDYNKYKPNEENGYITINFANLPAKIGEVDGHKVVLLKPLTYMNLSGDSIGPLAGFFKISADHVIVLCDDITQNPGKLRIRLLRPPPPGKQSGPRRRRTGCR